MVLLIRKDIKSRFALYIFAKQYQVQTFILYVLENRNTDMIRYTILSHIFKRNHLGHSDLIYFTSDRTHDTFFHKVKTIFFNEAISSRPVTIYSRYLIIYDQKNTLRSNCKEKIYSCPILFDDQGKNTDF